MYDRKENFNIDQAVERRNVINYSSSSFASKTVGIEQPDNTERFSDPEGSCRTLRERVKRGERLLGNGGE